MATDIIKLERVKHIYNKGQDNEYPALDDITLRIAAGDFVAVIGTNGSGKSTLAKHLNGLLSPDSGRCLIDGIDTSDAGELWRIRQLVGMVFQNPDNQIIATTVEEDVAFGPENLGLASAEIGKRVDEALQVVGMERYRQHAPHLLSGGQKQRVAIAGTIAMHTKCLVLDEPTAMLDPQGRQEVLRTAHELREKLGTTVVYITHFMEEAVTADRVIVMSNGRIVEDGSPREIFTQVAKLKNLGLDVPLAAQVAAGLRARGVKLAPNILYDCELAVALCRLA